ncbi:hypothetical protein EJB05_12691, partial [Eragrostis curvula]
MKLRSGRSLESQPPAVARRRCRRRRCHVDKLDRISDLPDDLLLHLLARLRCARAAARTSLLSRRWRGLWTHLPDLSFVEVAPDAVHGALAQVTRTDLTILNIVSPMGYKNLSSAGVASMLQTAARLAPTEFSLTVYGDMNDRNIATGVPCFHRATSIELHAQDIYLSPLVPPRELPLLLERLSFAHCRFDPADLNDLISRSPRLRVLEVTYCLQLATVRVHSASIEELAFKGSMDSVDIEAPTLKKCTLATSMNRDLSVSFSAPAVETLLWSCLCYNFLNVGIDGCPLPSFTEHFSYNFQDEVLRVNRNLMQGIIRLPKFSILELYIFTCGHVFGAMALNLLGACTAIKRLKVYIDQIFQRKDKCWPNCPCYESQNWRNENVSLVNLEQVELTNFQGSDNEVDFLKSMFRSATLMKTMTVTLSPWVFEWTLDGEKINNIFKENPSVKCCLYWSSGKKVQFV